MKLSELAKSHTAELCRFFRNPSVRPQTHANVSAQAAAARLEVFWLRARAKKVKNLNFPKTTSRGNFEISRYCYPADGASAQLFTKFVCTRMAW